MSTSDDNPAVPASDEDAVEQQGDPFLAGFVEAVNDIGRGPAVDFSFDVTLMIDGTLITGLLVSGKRWMEAMAAKIRADTAGTDSAPIAESLAAGFDRFGDAVYNSAEAPPAIGYLHLLNASPVAATGTWPEGLMLRVRFDRISAWTLGRTKAQLT